MTQYTLGNLVRINLHFTKILTGDANPTTVTIYVRKPDGTIDTHTEPEIIHDSTGYYHLDVTADQEGIWYYRGEGTGNVIAATEDTFDVVTIFNLGTCP